MEPKPIAYLDGKPVYGKLTLEQHQRINPAVWSLMARIFSRAEREAAEQAASGQ